MIKWSDPLTVGQYMFLKKNHKLDQDSRTLEITPNSKYAEEVIDELGLGNAKAAPTPFCEGVKPGDEEELNSHDAEAYRRMVGKLLYLALDRPDIQFGVKEMARQLMTPTASGMRWLRRMARYLLNGDVVTTIQEPRSQGRLVG